MKQKVEEAAMNFANYESNNLDKLPFKVKVAVDYDNGLTRGFKAGAEWAMKLKHNKAKPMCIRDTNKRCNQCHECDVNVLNPNY